MKLAFMPIVYRYPAAEFVMSTIQLIDHCKREGVPLYYRAMRGDALIERTRARAATHFLLDTSYDVLLQADDDIGFSPADAVQVAEQAMDYDIVCGVYLTRHRTAGVPTSYLEPGQTYHFFNGDPTPVPVRWAGGGFMAVHRRVYERLAKDLPLCHRDDDLRHYPFYPVMTVNDPVREDYPIRLSEDWGLCELARRAGFGVWANPNVRLAHFGATAFTLEDLLTELPERQSLTVERQANGDLTTTGRVAELVRS